MSAQIDEPGPSGNSGAASDHGSSKKGSVTEWLSELKRGSDRGTTELWERYFARLSRIASARLPRAGRRDFDEEDVALSAFQSFFEGAKDGRFPRLHDRDNLWSLLVVLTHRKAWHRLRDRGAAKRGGGRVHGESVVLGDRGGSLADILTEPPSDDMAEGLIERSTTLLAFLDDESLRTIALLKMQGLTNQEVAAQSGCALRTVERRLGLIRQLWTAYADKDEADTA